MSGSSVLTSSSDKQTSCKYGITSQGFATDWKSLAACSFIEVMFMEFREAAER